MDIVERIVREGRNPLIDTPEKRRLRLEADRRFTRSIAEHGDSTLTLLQSDDPHEVARARRFVGERYSSRVLGMLSELALVEATSDVEIVGWDQPSD